MSRSEEFAAGHGFTPTTDFGMRVVPKEHWPLRAASNGGERGVPPEPGSAIATTQDRVSNELVQKKADQLSRGEYAGGVSYVQSKTQSGKPVALVFDGHHYLAAAHRLGVEPEWWRHQGGRGEPLDPPKYRRKP